MRILTLLFLLSVIVACTKEESKVTKPYNYELSGWFTRDTAIKTDGLKAIDFSTDNYCWMFVTGGKDSLRCFGSYTQTSDSTLLWNGFSSVAFKLTLIEPGTGYSSLRVATAPPSNLLYGYVKLK